MGCAATGREVERSATLAPGPGASVADLYTSLPVAAQPIDKQAENSWHALCYLWTVSIHHVVTLSRTTKMLNFYKTVGMGVAGLGMAMAAQASLISNGDFSDGLNDWQISPIGGGGGAGGSDGGNAVVR